MSDDEHICDQGTCCECGGEHCCHDCPMFTDDWDSEPEPPFEDGPLKHQFVTFPPPHHGIHWFVEADDGEGTLRCHMVGDDQSWTHSAEDATVVDEDDVCSCGQVGCAWSPNGMAG